MSESRIGRMRPLVFILTAAAAATVFGYGFFREEIGEVLFNAAML
jgi:hypothetical protein